MGLIAVFGVAVVLSACGGGSVAAPGAPAATVVESATAVGVVEPSPVPTAVVADDDLIAAALAQLEADVGAGVGPADMIAFDVLDSGVDETGVVRFRVCAWTGLTAFDSVREVLYRTKVGEDGSVTASAITAPVAPGDCVNSQLVNTAIDFIDVFETYGGEIAADPPGFATNPGTDALLTDSYRERAVGTYAAFTADDFYLVTAFVHDNTRDDVVADILIRQYVVDDSSLRVLEIVTCRPMNPAYGIYSDGVLIDDERSPDSRGLHTIDAYQLEADPATELGWRITGDKGRIWGDCFLTGDWPAAANSWVPEDVKLEVLEW